MFCLHIFIKLSRLREEPPQPKICSKELNLNFKKVKVNCELKGDFVDQEGVQEGSQEKSALSRRRKAL